jgi:hypothetical protein
VHRRGANRDCGKPNATIVPEEVMGVEEDAMAKVIEFYIPANFQKQVKHPLDQQPGKLIEFFPLANRSAQVHASV